MKQSAPKPKPKPPPNLKLRAAREALPSPSGAPGMCMSRQELAEAANDHVWKHKGQQTNLSDRDIGRYERGEAHWPDHWRRYGLRGVLGVDSDTDLGFYPNRWTGTNLADGARGLRSPAPDRAAAAVAVADPPLAAVGAVSRGALPVQVSVLEGVGEEVDQSAVPTAGGVIAANALLPMSAREPGEPGMATEAAMQAFRSADRRLGGGYLYGTVVDFLRTEVAPKLFGAGDTSADGKSELAAAAAFAEMAGWMAHDCGRDDDAWRHLSRSLDLVRVADDRQLHIHVLASLAHLADHGRRPAEADQLASEGLDRIGDGSRDPDLEARLLALRARAAAARGTSAECVRLLGMAERSLGARRSEAHSPWVNQFDEAALASETTRCTLRLGDLRETQRQAERVVKLRPADQAPRSHAFGKLALITVLVAQAEWDAVCALGRDVLDSTASLGSALVLQQLTALQHQLEALPERTRLVNEFLSHLRPALRQRRWLHARLCAAPAGPRGGQ